MLECEYLLKIIVIIAMVTIILFGICKIFELLKRKEQGLGDNSVKTIGIILFLPILLLLAILTDFQTETLAALLGTVAGYVLSGSKSGES